MPTERPTAACKDCGCEYPPAENCPTPKCCAAIARLASERPTVSESERLALEWDALARLISKVRALLTHNESEDGDER